MERCRIGALRGAGRFGVALLAQLGTLAWPARAQESGDDAAGATGRAWLAERAARSLSEQRVPKAVAPTAKEQAFGLELEAVETTGLRMLGTVGREECTRVARGLVAARTLFVELTGASSAFYPQGLTAYLLGTSEAKDQFLLKHAALNAETRARIARLYGTGIPGTADWAWWEGDAERRMDGMVRIGFGWLADTQKVTIERHAWLHEGLGFYLTHALTGAYLTWFVPIQASLVTREMALFTQLGDPGVDWCELARGLFAPEQGFDLEELLHLEANELAPSDYLRAHALAAYLVEVRREALGPLIQRLGAGEDARRVLEELLGCSLAELSARLGPWLDAREVLIARAEGRRPESELSAQWEGLTPYQRRGASEAFARAVDALDTQHLRWLRAVLAAAPAEVRPAGEAPFYDPKVHAPAQPIARKRLPAADSRVKRLLQQVTQAPLAGAAVLAHDYDWGSGTVVRVGPPDDPETIFRNALLGVPPRADLARALVLATLDRADERALQAAFAHAYTDREGNVFPFTLYDAWASGLTIEMPDVDTLGIVHEVMNEWSRWTAPVPSSKHDALYKVIGEHFLAAKRSRELRLALADLFLFPKAPPRPGYETQLLNLHALWAEHESDPARLAPVLPDGKGWEAFLSANTERCRADHKLFSGGRRRAALLRKDAQALQRALGAALDEAARLPPEPPAVEASSGGTAGG
jgi:hypothetical protein